MLVLTRKAGSGDQSTIIIPKLTGGGEVEVIVLESKGDQVRLGIKASRGVSVDRKEIWLEKRQGSQTSDSGAVQNPLD